jgi:transposase InsO family protein
VDNKCTKWIEAMPFIIQDATSLVNFIKLIVLHSGVPNIIITDNGSSFTSREFQDYCKELGIQLNFASVVHP